MRKYGWIAWPIITYTAVVAWLAISPNFVRTYDWDPVVVHSSQAKQNLHTISLALERYASDNSGIYPATLQPLRDQAYLSRLPDNPYDHASSRGPMPEVPLGQHVAGGVTYLPHLLMPATGQQHVDTYALLVYGDERSSRSMRKEHTSQRCALPKGAESRVAWDYVLQVLSNDPSLVEVRK